MGLDILNKPLSWFLSQGKDDGPTQPEAPVESDRTPAGAMQFGTTQPTQREIELEAQLSAEKAKNDDIERQRLADEAIRREADAVAFAAQYASLFAENGSEVEGDEIESDRAKFTKVLADLHLAAQQTGTVEKLSALCAKLTEAKPTATADVLGEAALGSAKPATPAASDKPTGVKAADAATSIYKQSDTGNGLASK